MNFSGNPVAIETGNKQDVLKEVVTEGCEAALPQPPLHTHTTTTTAPAPPSPVTQEEEEARERKLNFEERVRKRSVKIGG